MKNVRISYTVAMAEVPHEIDRLVKTLKKKCHALTLTLAPVSFKEDAAASMHAMQSFRTRLQDLELVLADCENLGRGLVDLEENLMGLDEATEKLKDIQEGLTGTQEGHPE